MMFSGFPVRHLHSHQLDSSGLRTPALKSSYICMVTLSSYLLIEVFWTCAWTYPMLKCSSISHIYDSVNVMAAQQLDDYKC